MVEIDPQKPSLTLNGQASSASGTSSSITCIFVYGHMIQEIIALVRQSQRSKDIPTLKR